MSKKQHSFRGDKGHSYQAPARKGAKSYNENIRLAAKAEQGKHSKPWAINPVYFGPRKKVKSLYNCMTAAKGKRLKRLLKYCDISRYGTAENPF